LQLNITTDLIVPFECVATLNREIHGTFLTNNGPVSVQPYRSQNQSWLPKQELIVLTNKPQLLQKLQLSKYP